MSAVENATDRRRGKFASFAIALLCAVVALLCAFALDLRSVANETPGVFGDDLRALALFAAHGLALLLPVALGTSIAYRLFAFAFPRACATLVSATSIRSIFKPNTALVASMVSASVFALASVVGVARIVSYSLATFSSPSVIAIVIGIVASAHVMVVRALTKLVEPSLERFFRGLEIFGSPALVHLVFVLALLASYRRLLEVDPAMHRALPWSSIVSLSTFVLGFVVFCSTLEEWRMKQRSLVRVGAFMLCLIVVATPTSVALYGKTNSQRVFVEELVPSTRIAYRLVAELLDRDRDGYPALLGGRDCNDRDASIHPGAMDTKGDRIDSDCFGGDGSPPFDDRQLVNASAPVLSDGALPNILFISVDTLRADRLGVASYPRKLTPRIDALGQSSVVFTNAQSQSPRTTRAMPAIFTGQHPGAIKFERSLNRLDISKSVETLAERMSSRYQTAAILGTSYFTLAPNILDGFASVIQAPVQKSEPAYTTDRTIEWLNNERQTGRPFFLWAHFFAPHEPYLVDRTPSLFGRTPLDLYDTEVARADHEVGRVLDALKALELDEDTVVIVCSDHGESLGERGVFGHSSRLTQDQIHAVLMIRAPGVQARVEGVPVALFDLHATILDMANLVSPTPESARSLLPLMRGDRRAFVDRPIFSEILPDAVYAIETQAVRRGNDKLIFSPRSGRYSLYDLGTDPKELRDLADRRPSLARELRDLILSWDASLRRPDNRTGHLIDEAIVAEIPDAAERLDASFANGITLVAGQIETEHLRSGGRLIASLYFRAERPIANDYAVHLTYETTTGASPASIVAHHMPLEGALPTSRFRPGVIYRDRVVIEAPAGLPSNAEYVAQVELWTSFHTRNPVSVAFGGRASESVRFGSVTAR